MNFKMTGSAQPLHIKYLLKRFVAVPVMTFRLANKPALLAVVGAGNDASANEGTHSDSSVSVRISVFAPIVFGRFRLGTFPRLFCKPLEHRAITRLAPTGVAGRAGLVEIEISDALCLTTPRASCRIVKRSLVLGTTTKITLG